jgi:hypothetical protein
MKTQENKIKEKLGELFDLGFDNHLKLSEIINNKKQKEEKMNETKSMLPAGEYTDAEGNVFVVAEDGTCTPKAEMACAPKEEEMGLDTTEVPVGDKAPEETVSGTTETKLEEMAAAPVDESPAESVGEVQPEAPAEAAQDAPVESYSKEEVDAKLEEIYKMLADMVAEDDAEDIVEGPAAVAMSIHEKFDAFVAFSNKENK